MELQLTLLKKKSGALLNKSNYAGDRQGAPTNEIRQETFFFGKNKFHFAADDNATYGGG